MNVQRAILFVLVLLAAAAAGMFAQRWTDAETRTSVGFTPAESIEKRPAFTLADFDGVERSSLEWKDKALLVNFWATWCAPCRDEIPLLIELQKRHGSEGLQVIGVALESDRQAVKKFSAEFGINYPVLVGEQGAIDIAEGFGIDVLALPATAFSRADGSISGVHLGLLEADDADKALAETLR